MKKLQVEILVAAALAGPFVALPLLDVRTAMAADSDRMERTVSVSASGSVVAEPDIASISAGVVSEADAAKDAVARNNAVMAKVIDGLKRAGVAAKDIQTTHLSIEPRYKQSNAGQGATNNRSIDGYRVTSQVRLTVRDVRRLGEVLDQAISLGANQIGQITFDVADSELLKDAARRQAMENARRRGELYAHAAGAQLGPVLRVSEGVASLLPSAGVTVFAAPHGVPIEAGTRRLDVEVQVVYALR